MFCRTSTMRERSLVSRDQAGYLCLDENEWELERE